MPLDSRMVRSAEVNAPMWPGDRNNLPQWGKADSPRQVHVVPSMSMGGAERIVADLAQRWASAGSQADIIVMRDAGAEHSVGGPGISVHRLGKMPWPERLAYAAGVIQSSGAPAYCHLTSQNELESLWKLGCKTIPVVHNARDGWRTDPISWERDEVPFVVACGDIVAQDLIEHGVKRPIRVIRHVLSANTTLTAQRRAEIRQAFGASSTTLLIGMVGRIVIQKRYTRAVRILSDIAQMGIDVRLAILGATTGDEGATARAAIENEARRLCVRDLLVVPGAVPDARNLVGAFDVFLNTSMWEGVSIATMEAVAAGVPVVTANVGGQCEAIGSNDILMSENASDLEWAEAVVKVSGQERGLISVERAADSAAHIWPWMATLGPGSVSTNRKLDVLFVTGNMDVGGAQRSLCNLVAELPSRNLRVAVAIAGKIGVPGFMERAMAAGVSFVDVSTPLFGQPVGALRGRASRVLSLIREVCPRTVAFWNMDVATKLMVAKCLEGGPVRLADVSPGPMLYKELAEMTEFARLLSTSPSAYISSLHLLVSKYTSGTPPIGMGAPKSFAVIPNGVPEPEGVLTLGDGPCPPQGSNPSFAAVTVGRLVPAKRPDLLPRVAKALDRILPGATLTVVGGLHNGSSDVGWQSMLDACDGVIPENLQFHGPDHRATQFLGRFACFYMVSEDQGCPNASLEAMSVGLPVVANPDGGTAEQVTDGVNGYLVSDDNDPESYAIALATALARVMSNPTEAQRMGQESRKRAKLHFSMSAMADSYVNVLIGQ